MQCTADELYGRNAEASSCNNSYTGLLCVLTTVASICRQYPLVGWAGVSPAPFLTPLDRRLRHFVLGASTFGPQY